MSLSSDLVSAFAKITNDERPKNTEGSTAYGRYVLQNEKAYVQIDGSDVLTPVATTAEAKNGDRVTIMIKNHKAIVTGNLSDPSASGARLTNVSDQLIEFGSTILSPGIGYLNFITYEIEGSEHLSGFRIMNTPTLQPDTKGWIANISGIGWSSDGFQTISKIGLEMETGRIYADEITAGSVLTNSFQIGDAMTFNGDTGMIRFGGKVSLGWDSIEDAEDNVTYITQNAIQTGDLHLGGSVYRMIGDYWWDSDEYLLVGVNGYDNLQLGSPSDSVNYKNTNIYAPENIYLVPGGETVSSSNWTMVVRGPSSATGQGVSIHGNLSVTGEIYKDGSSLITYDTFSSTINDLESRIEALEAGGSE